ncbi:MAG: IPT/TIG domain-containing protein, partial [Planctomycetota bacterium]
TLEVVDPPPAVTNINPPDGPHTGGTTVTITGTGYQTGAIVLFGDREADQVTVDSALQITAVTAATSQSGAVDLHIENPDGQLAVAVSGFTYTAQPAISSVYPTAGAAAGGTELTVYGSDFTSGATITVGGTSASIVSIGPTEIRCVAPAGVQGPADLGVANPGGLSDTLVGGFTYLAASDPSIASVSPASGGAGGGTVVSIAGAGFEAGARVFFGAGGAGIGVQGTGISVESASLVTATTPAHAVGSADAWVENPTGAAARLPGGFTFLGSSGGGGGGCFAVAPMLPPSGRAGAMGALLPLFFLMLLVAALRAVRRAPGSRSLPVEKRISP